MILGVVSGDGRISMSTSRTLVTCLRFIVSALFNGNKESAYVVDIESALDCLIYPTSKPSV